MASKRSRPEPGEGRAVVDGSNADTGTASADKCGQAVSAFEGASVPAVVARLWEAATCADPTPARGYLARCGCWPGRHVRAPLPADSVRWLAREAAPEPDAAGGWHGLPPGAAGAVVLAWRPSTSADPGRPGRASTNPVPVAVTLVALDARGFPVREARSTVGSRAGAMFRAGGRADDAAVRVWANDEGQPHANGWLETPWLSVLGGTQR